MTGREPEPILTEDEQEDYDLSEHATWEAVGDPNEDRLAFQTAARSVLRESLDQRVEVFVSKRELTRRLDAAPDVPPAADDQVSGR
ncbi:hypothetical protein [Jiella sonneratiae]|uniref:Uncharacterized protein n=1 Tax=Jiella sonneratiae TaxID=2816856 RepID=A0ABS3J2T1_9HYPH|nr:hypothetical protein [Jiella sonneratiae]MBO0903977.1 hypothetical protein [Jiella sonneratiae]